MDKYELMFLSLINKHAESLSYAQLDYCLYFIFNTYKTVPELYEWHFPRFVEQRSRRSHTDKLPVQHVKKFNAWCEREVTRIACKKT